MPRKRKVPGAGADPRGGVRQGNPGKPYPNRSDLRAQPVRTATGQPYGAAGAQAAAQQAVPLPQAPPAGGAGAAAGGGPQYSYPEDVPNLTDPSQRPEEPLTAGMPFGPGAGPRMAVGPQDTLGDQLRALYLAHPTPELRDLLEDYAFGD